jgi:hypothetical protein
MRTIVKDHYTGYEGEHEFSFVRRDARGDELVFDTPNVTYSKLKGATRDLSNGRDADASYFGAEPIVLTRADVARLQREGAVHEVRR